MIASEALPFAKTGGLADVAGALPFALGRLGHRVTLVLPRYREVGHVGMPGDRCALTLGGRRYDVRFVECPLGERARAVLVDCAELYDRDGLYGVDNHDHPDNAQRFAILARAALEFAVRAGERPSVVHAHEWQAGLAPVYLRTLYREDPRLAGVPSVFTIHNIAYQGVFSADTLTSLDLGWDLFTTDGLEYWNQISLLKAGINFSDAITTVSETYAREILTPEFGFGFDGILRRRAGDFTGILNGIDTERWNPSQDPFLPEPFSADDLSGKLAAKREVLGRYHLPTDGPALDRPLVGMISRLVDQKGLDLVAQAAEPLSRLDATFVVLGSGEPRYQDLWTSLAAHNPDRIGARIGFDERLAHLIEGGADLFLMPSRYEPCGLNQMYSLRYGTVPVVRATGGLEDTVEQYDEHTGQGNGFKFGEYSAGALLEALTRALEVFGRKAAWRALQVAGMRQDHSWDLSARRYVLEYRKAMRQGQATGVENVPPAANS